jgi:putative lipoic acid-binding regulatory protein
MTDPAKPLLEFPCAFPLKVIGKDADDFERFVLSLLARHVPPAAMGEVSSRPSGAGTYVAVTATFTATSQAQLDDIYRDLGAQARVLIAL